jgi:oxygen-independent coproporphyrinogen-3 oxidase
VVYAGRSARGPASRIAELVDALLVELELRADALDRAHGPPATSQRPPLTSVYLGGGTPSLLMPHSIRGLLHRVRERLGLAEGAEITLEANPGPDERGDLAGFREAGITRLSIGAQSLSHHELNRLGRRHSPADVAATVREARQAGFASVSLDLLYDVPGQTLDTWRATLEEAVALEPDHVSTYVLTLDDADSDRQTGPDGDHLPVRPGARRWRDSARTGQDQDRAAAMDADADEALAAAGFERYELANHARPGHRSRHNLAYWQRLPYLALGPGAHAFDGALERSWATARLDRYLRALLPPDGAAPGMPPGGVDRLDPATAHAESVILALRLRDGIGMEVAGRPEFAPALDWARIAGLAERVADRVRLTPAGRLLSNEVFLRLLPSEVPFTGEVAQP